MFMGREKGGKTARLGPDYVACIGRVQDKEESICFAPFPPHLLFFFFGYFLVLLKNT